MFLQNSTPACFNTHFSHIYAEERILDHPRTAAILRHFPSARILPIRHYKDIFNRSRQNISLQQQAKSLILASREGPLVYAGAPVCQSFGEEHFYYSSCVMNCVFDCEYCYLKGMYPSAYPVIFVNLEDYFAQVDRLLEEHPVYLCISYDTDLLAIESLTGYVRAWSDFAAGRPNLRLEIRTKSAPLGIWKELPARANVIFAFTLSPQEVVRRYEHGTPSLEQRLLCAQTALGSGHPVRLCFDPMIYCSDWERHYSEMAGQVLETIDLSRIRDVSIGSFRISQDYLKKMRRVLPGSAVVQFPFVNEGGYYGYGKELADRMEVFLMKRLSETIPAEKMFRWK